MPPPPKKKPTQIIQPPSKLPTPVTPTEPPTPVTVPPVVPPVFTPLTPVTPVIVPPPANTIGLGNSGIGNPDGGGAPGATLNPTAVAVTIAPTTATPPPVVPPGTTNTPANVAVPGLLQLQTGVPPGTPANVAGGTNVPLTPLVAPPTAIDPLNGTTIVVCGGGGGCGTSTTTGLGGSITNPTTTTTGTTANTATTQTSSPILRIPNTPTCTNTIGISGNGVSLRSTTTQYKIGVKRNIEVMVDMIDLQKVMQAMSASGKHNPLDFSQTISVFIDKQYAGGGKSSLAAGLLPNVLPLFTGAAISAVNATQELFAGNFSGIVDAAAKPFCNATLPNFQQAAILAIGALGMAVPGSMSPQQVATLQQISSMSGNSPGSGRVPNAQSQSMLTITGNLIQGLTYYNSTSIDTAPTFMTLSPVAKIKTKEKLGYKIGYQLNAQLGGSTSAYLSATTVLGIPKNLNIQGGINTNLGGNTNLGLNIFYNKTPDGRSARGVVFGVSSTFK